MAYLHSCCCYCCAMECLYCGCCYYSAMECLPNDYYVMVSCNYGYYYCFVMVSCTFYSTVSCYCLKEWLQYGCWG